MTTKTIRSRFEHEVGETLEGCRILEKRVVIPPDPIEHRRGVYDYDVEVAPTPAKEKDKDKDKSKAAVHRSPAAASEDPSFTRAAPDEIGGVIRRIPRR